MYRVLYRKWRPQVFSDVVGQEHITKTLMGAVESGRVSHAYLFTGTRGTGKTTCAKILAKAVNCEHPVNGNPCNECPSCKGIDDGSIVDVVEIDAASNNGVDNIRDLREETNYMPSNVKYRVYIIDEVHMLSPGAFNALLKTLEEPPEYVKFILATTEVHKLPSTILSRCQRFDFKRISAQDIAKRLKYVAENENIPLTDDGAALIAKVADGAMRDALSLLDRCASYGKVIDEAVACDATGLAGKQHIYSLVDAVMAHDCGQALNILDGLYSNSCDMERLFSELISHFRNMMIVLTVPDSKELILAGEAETEKIRQQAEKLTLARVLSYMDILNNTVIEFKRGSNKRTAAEMALIRLTADELETDISSLLIRISELEKKLASGDFTPRTPSGTASEETRQVKAQPVNPPAPPSKQSEPDGANEVGAEKKPDEKQESTTLNREAPPLSVEPTESGLTKFNKLSEIAEIISKSDPMISGFLNGASAFLDNNSFFIKPANTYFEKFFNQKEHFMLIQDAVLSVVGRPVSVRLYDENNINRMSEKKEAKALSPIEDLVNRAKQLNIEIIDKGAQQ